MVNKLTWTYQLTRHKRGNQLNKDPIIYLPTEYRRKNTTTAVCFVLLSLIKGQFLSAWMSTAVGFEDWSSFRKILLSYWLEIKICVETSRCIRELSKDMNCFCCSCCCCCCSQCKKTNYPPAKHPSWSIKVSIAAAKFATIRVVIQPESSGC